MFKLNPGDIVDIVAPAWPCSQQELRAGVSYLKKMGLTPRVPKNLFSKSDFLCANTKIYRLNHLQKALNAKDSKAIWCIRGGYGSNHLIADLLKLKKPKMKKMLIGYSDITMLHSFLNTKWKWPSLHASVLDGLGKGLPSAQSQKNLKNFLFNSKKELTYTKLKAINSKAKKTTQLNKLIVGGNLSILQTTIGTAVQLDLKNKILFVEDTGERGYNVDRMLNHLEQAGYFKGLSAIIFGEFVYSKESNGKNLVPGVIKNFSNNVNFPVYSGLKVGHGAHQNPIPCLYKAKIIKEGLSFTLGIKID